MNLQRFSCLIALTILGMSLSAWSEQPATVPAGSRRIELVLVRAERGSSNSRAFTNYYLTITNREDFPEDLFEPAPDLPPCGLNKNSSRTWLEIYSSNGSRIYGYCAMKSAAELEEFSFSIPDGQSTPRKVYVRLIDRRLNTIYESNLVSTKGVISSPAIVPTVSIELVLVRAERGSSNSRAFTSYYLTITNRGDFPEDLFEPAPDLPPCGLNKNSSRTWLEIYSNTGSRIYGYCAMKSTAELEEFSFGIPDGQPTPKKVYVRLIDRRSNTIYESNLVSTRGVVHK